MSTYDNSDCPRPTRLVDEKTGPTDERRVFFAKSRVSHSVFDGVLLATADATTVYAMTSWPHVSASREYDNVRDAPSSLGRGRENPPDPPRTTCTFTTSRPP